MNVINVTHKNTETLMDTFSRGSSALLVGNNDINFDSIFPINNNEQLSFVESKIIQEQEFRNILVIFKYYLICIKIFVYLSLYIRSQVMSLLCWFI